VRTSGGAGKRLLGGPYQRLALLENGRTDLRKARSDTRIMAEALKDSFGVDVPERIAKMSASVYPSFNTESLGGTPQEFSGRSVSGARAT
jgi:hypothetical protein